MVALVELLVVVVAVALGLALVVLLVIFAVVAVVLVDLGTDVLVADCVISLFKTFSTSSWAAALTDTSVDVVLLLSRKDSVLILV